jgi:hypothetical protein
MKGKKKQQNKKRTQQLLIRARAWKGEKRRWYFKIQIKNEIILDIIIRIFNAYSCHSSS